MLLTCLFFDWPCASQQIHNLCWGDAEVSPLTFSVKFSSLCCSRAPAAANFHRLSKSHVRMCWFRENPTWILLYQMQVYDLNVRTSQRFIACSGFVSVFSSALCADCFRCWTFAQVGVKAGFCTVPRGPDEVILKKKRKKGLCKCQFGHHARKLFSKNNVATASGSLCCPFQDKR